MWFGTAGETHVPARWRSCQAPKKTTSRGEGSDGSRSGHDDVVALSQQEAEMASRKKSLFGREITRSEVYYRCSSYLYSLLRRSVGIYVCVFLRNTVLEVEGRAVDSSHGVH